jgi:hypothetical protein
MTAAYGTCLHPFQLPAIVRPRGNIVEAGVGPKRVLTAASAGPVSRG